MSRSLSQTVATLALSLGLFLPAVSEPPFTFGTDFGLERRRSRTMQGQQVPRESQPSQGTRTTMPLAESDPGPGYAASGQMIGQQTAGQTGTPVREAASQTVRRPIFDGAAQNSATARNSGTPSPLISQPVAEARRPHPSVARVIAFDRTGQQFGSGTYVGDLGEYGIVLTNWHVVNDADGLVHVHFPSGFGSYGAVIAVDDVWDLAAIAISKPRKGVPKLPIARSVPKPGEPLWIVGYGAGAYRMAGGRCLRYLAPQETLEAGLIDLSVNAREGDSGGPILNEDGQVAGVLFGSDYRNTVGSNCVKVQEFLDKALPLFKNLHADPEELFANVERGGPKRRLTDTRKPPVLTPQPRAATSASYGSNTRALGAQVGPSSGTATRQSGRSVETTNRSAERSAVFRQATDTERQSYIRQQSFSTVALPSDEPAVKMVPLNADGVPSDTSNSGQKSKGRADSSADRRSADRRSITGWVFSLLISTPLLIFLLRRSGRSVTK